MSLPYYFAQSERTHHSNAYEAPIAAMRTRSIPYKVTAQTKCVAQHVVLQYHLMPTSRAVLRRALCRTPKARPFTCWILTPLSALHNAFAPPQLRHSKRTLSITSTTNHFLSR